VIERASIVANIGAIQLNHLPSGSFDVRSIEQSLPTPPERKGGQLMLQPGQPLSQAEEAYIKLTLEYVNNNRKRAAEILGISLRTLQNRIAEFQKEAKAATTDE
jgi:DNA-binding NtrC family response regulator